MRKFQSTFDNADEVVKTLLDNGTDVSVKAKVGGDCAGYVFNSEAHE